jgi:hypothetical protein
MSTNSIPIPQQPPFTNTSPILFDPNQPATDKTTAKAMNKLAYFYGPLLGALCTVATGETHDGGVAIGHFNFPPRKPKDLDNFGSLYFVALTARHLALHPNVKQFMLPPGAQPSDIATANDITRAFIAQKQGTPLTDGTGKKLAQIKVGVTIRQTVLTRVQQGLRTKGFELGQDAIMLFSIVCNNPLSRGFLDEKIMHRALAVRRQQGVLRSQPADHDENKGSG